MSKLVQIRMLTRGPNKTYRPKAVVLVDEARAAALIAGKHAEPVEKEAGHADD